MKKIIKFLITIICLIIPAQVSANIVPIVMPIPMRMGNNDLRTSKDRIEQYRGLSKLTDDLLNLQITKEDYKDLMTHFKDKRSWTEKTIDETLLQNLKATKFILVHDVNVNEVYEIPQEEIKNFIKENYKDANLDKDYDAIAFTIGKASN